VKGVRIFSPSWKAVLLSLLHIGAAVAIYRFLYTGGWLTHHYDLRDPDSFNLIPVIFEPIAVLSVLSYWIWRTPFLYRLMLILAVVQLLIIAGFAVLILAFMLTYHPRMM
jgi:hypothetical protein